MWVYISHSWTVWEWIPLTPRFARARALSSGNISANFEACLRRLPYCLAALQLSFSSSCRARFNPLACGVSQVLSLGQADGVARRLPRLEKEDSDMGIAKRPLFRGRLWVFKSPRHLKEHEAEVPASAIAARDMGVAQNSTGGVTQVLVHVSAYQGSILLPF